MITTHLIATFVCLSIFSNMQIDPTDITIDGAQSNGFAFRSRMPGDQYFIDYSRAVDKTKLYVEAFTVGPERDRDRAWRVTITSAEYSEDQPASLSGMALGHRSVALAKGQGMYQQAMLNQHIVNVQMASQQKEARLWSPDHWSEQDRELVEGAARHALARMAGRSLQAAGNATVNGRTITGMMRTEGGLRMAPLEAWADARSIELNRNVLAGTASFSFQGRSVILALACDKAKVNAQWKELGGFLLRRGTTWYVPLDGIEAALR